MGININPETGEINEWHYQEGEKIDFSEEQKQTEETAAAQKDSEVVELQAPITEEQIRDLKVGDVVSITGRMYTGRDAIHHTFNEP